MFLLTLVEIKNGIVAYFKAAFPAQELPNSHTYHYPVDAVAMRSFAGTPSVAGLKIDQADNIPCDETPFDLGEIDNKEQIDFLYEMGMITQEERLDRYADIDADTIKIANILR